MGDGGDFTVADGYGRSTGSGETAGGGLASSVGDGGGDAAGGGLG